MKETYKVVYDNGIDCVDGFECETLEEAKERVMSIYESWIDKSHSYSIEEWNEMIINAYCEVYRFEGDVPMFCDYPDYPHWAPSDEDLEMIGWVEREDIDD